MNCPEFPKIDTLYTRDDNHVITNVIRRPEFLVPAKWLVTEKIDGTNIRISLEQESCSHAGLDHPGAGLTGTCDMPWAMVIRGRTSRAQIPTLLFEHLQKTFTVEGLKSLWRCKSSCRCLGEGIVTVEDGPNTSECGNKASQPLAIKPCSNLEPYPITLYGEGYGGGIQKGGGAYTSKTKGGKASFRLFDVFIGETWLDRENVEDIASKLGIKTVPLISPPKPIAYGSDPASPRISFGGVTHAYAEAPWDLESITNFVRDGAPSTVAYEEGTEGHMAEGVMAFTSPPLFNSRGKRLMWKLKHKDFQV